MNSFLLFSAFEAIFTFMQCGILCAPLKVPYVVFLQELQFFGFHDTALDLYSQNAPTPPKRNPERSRRLEEVIFEG